MTSARYDFIIIGSGYGGLLTAWRLTRAGARVCLVERGRRWQPHEFRATWDPRYLAELYDISFSNSYSEIYRTSRIFGGGSVLNSMMHQRTPSEAFDFVDPDTSRRAWPHSINRATLNSFYAQVEDLLSVRQLEYYEIPRIGANFGRLFRDAGLSCDRGRFNLSQLCTRRGFCEAGCSAGGKVTLCDRVLQETLDTGNLTIVENRTAVKIVPVGSGYRVDCVITGRPLTSTVEESFTANRVICAAGPMGTVPLLLRSRSYLRQLSPTLGRWVNNNGDVNFIFETPTHYDNHYGHRSTNNAGMISYAFWNPHRVTMHAGFAPVGVMAALNVRREGELSWGLQHKHYVRRHVIHRLIPVNAMKQIPSNLQMTIDSAGLPRIQNPPGDFMERHGAFMLQLATQVAESAGARVLLTGQGASPLDMGGNHILGGARMSDDAATGVVNSSGEVHGHTGLFVADASCIPSTLGINPSLTIAANALRMAHEIVGRGV